MKFKHRISFANLFTIFFFVGFWISELCDGAKFYKYPVKIPTSSVSGRTKANLDRAVQFLVTNGKDGAYHFGFDTGIHEKK